MRSMRSRVPEKSELAAQLKRYRYDAGLKGDEAGAVIGKKATTVYKYEAGTLWVSPGDLRALLNEYGVNMVTAFTEVGDPRAGGRKKDESALRWRKMRAYYDMMGPAKQRTLLICANQPLRGSARAHDGASACTGSSSAIDGALMAWASVSIQCSPVSGSSCSAKRWATWPTSSNGLRVLTR